MAALKVAIPTSAFAFEKPLHGGYFGEA